MRLAEIVVGIVLLGLFFRPDILRCTSVKFVFVLLTAYLARENLALGCLAAAVLIRSLYETPTPSWRPPRVDQLGMDTLLRPQESFFRPALRLPGDPVAELSDPYTPF